MGSAFIEDVLAAPLRTGRNDKYNWSLMVGHRVFLTAFDSVSFVSCFTLTDVPLCVGMPRPVPSQHTIERPAPSQNPNVNTSPGSERSVSLVRLGPSGVCKRQRSFLNLCSETCV